MSLATDRPVLVLVVIEIFIITGIYSAESVTRYPDAIFHFAGVVQYAEGALSSLRHLVVGTRLVLCVELGQQRLVGRAGETRSRDRTNLN